MHLRGFTKRQYFAARRLTESPTEVPRDFPTESPKCARHYVFRIIVILGGRIVHIVKFINWGCLLTEGGGYMAQGYAWRPLFFEFRRLVLSSFCWSSSCIAVFLAKWAKAFAKFLHSCFCRVSVHRYSFESAMQENIAAVPFFVCLIFSVYVYSCDHS